MKKQIKKKKIKVGSLVCLELGPTMIVSQIENDIVHTLWFTTEDVLQTGYFPIGLLINEEA